MPANSQIGRVGGKLSSMSSSARAKGICGAVRASRLTASIITAGANGGRGDAHGKVGCFPAAGKPKTATITAGMATPQPAPLQTQRAPASPAGLFIAGADKGALAARRTLQPTDQHDDADDRRGDPDLDGTVPVKRAEHWRTLYARFGVSAAQPIAPGLCCSPALSRVWAAPYSAPLLRVT